jgi:phosphonate transport system substrate-binding protein
MRNEIFKVERIDFGIELRYSLLNQILKEDRMSKKMLLILSILIIGTLAFSACAPAAEPAPGEEEVIEEAAPVEEAPVEEAAPAEWYDGLGTEENPIIFVAVPSGETERVLSGFDKMASLIYESSGLVIEPFVATDYTSAIEAMCQNPPKAHMGSLATFAYILASAKGCAETELVSTRFGTAFYNGQFIVKSDSDLEKLEDLKGKSWCIPYKNSTSGEIIPGMMLKGVGIDPLTDLGEIVEAGSHEAAAAGVYNGDCDFATTYVDARSRIDSVDPEITDIMDVTKVIALMPDIPNDGIQFVTGFPQELRDKLITAILALFETEEGKAAMDEAYQWEGMEKHDDTFYDPFRQILDAAGISAEELAEE